MINCIIKAAKKQNNGASAESNYDSPMHLRYLNSHNVGVSELKSRTHRFFRILPLLLIFVSFASGLIHAAKPANNVGGTFDSPDFAFPKSVSKNAAGVYKKALKSGDAAVAIKAAIELDIADALVSESAFSANAARFAELSNMLPVGYSAIGYILEARLYSDLYSANSYKFDRLTLPEGDTPDNVMEWSRGLILGKINELVDSAVRQRPQLELMPISSLKSVIIDPADAIKADFNLFDFAAYQIGLVYKPFVGRGGNVIPFGDKVSRLDNPRSKTEMLLQDCEDNAYKSGNLEKATFFAMQVLNMQPESTRERYLDQCLARYADSKWGAQFIVQKNDFRQMESFLQKYPDAPAIRDVKLAIANLLQQHIEVTVPGQVLPGQEFAAQVKSANISDLYLLVVSLPTANPEKDFKYSDLSKSGKLVQVAPVNFNMQKPASSDTTVNLKGLASGLYAVVPSSTREIAGVINSGSKQSVSVMQVSSLAAQIVTAGKERTLYIVKGTDSKPIVGARVSVWPIVKGARGAAKKLVTNAEGTVKLSDTQAFFLAKEGSDMVWGRVYNAYENQKDIKKNYRASLFADRSIYRPGSKAGLALVLWSEQENVLASAADETVRVVLNDAKYQPVDTLELTTDKFGRCNADITIPQDKPLGTWHIEAVCRGNYAGSTSFEVADYKAPTFSVSLVSSSDNWTPGSTLVFRGEARTYAGMAVANARVEATVNSVPLWWRYTPSASPYTLETNTDADGKFAIELPTSGLSGTDFEKGAFRLEVIVTDAAGETVKSEPLRFSLGSGMAISANLPDQYELNDKDPVWNVNVTDLAGKSLVKEVEYKIRNLKGETVQSGTFNSPVFSPELESLPSAKYNVTFYLPSDTTVRAVENEILIWRANDTKAPGGEVLWVGKTEQIIPAGAKSHEITILTESDNRWVLVNVADDSKVLSSQWVEVKNGRAVVRVEAPESNHRYFVTLNTCNNLKYASQVITLIPEPQKEELNISTVTFRDRIAPGSPEKWTFRLATAGKTAITPVIAVMTDKALNALSPFRWNFNPQSYLYWNRGANTRWISERGFSSNYTWLPVENVPGNQWRFSNPNWETWGYQLWPSETIYIRGTNDMKLMRSAGAIHYNSAAKACDTVVEESCVENEVAMSTADEGSGSESQESSEPQLRLTETPIAFFMPALKTDDSGNVEIKFDAPDFIGTWQLQILGYDSDMHGAVRVLEVVSARKVMAKLNAPRFLRTGDVATVSATIFNNSSDDSSIETVISVLDAETGEAIISKSCETRIYAPGTSRVEAVDFTVPVKCKDIVIRVTAETDGCQDGEQAIVPVLPSSTPVTEGKAFWLAPSQEYAEIKIPDYPADAEMELHFCTNPIEEAVAALPSLKLTDSSNVLILSDALFNLAVAAGINRQYPGLIKNINICEVDSLLGVSAYRLQSMQKSDGGWSWWENMPTSEYITTRVISTAVTLKQLGYLPAQVEKLLPAACRFVEDGMVADWKRTNYKSIPVQSVIGYLYYRDNIGGAKSTSEFNKLASKAIESASKNWKKYSIYDKATTAVVFGERHKRSESLMILKSIGEYSSYSKDKGMWFDRERGIANGMGPVLTTLRVLDAYNSLTPQAPEIDKLRQWVLTGKQTLDWGGGQAASQTVAALLNCGTDWTPAVAIPMFEIDNKQLPAGLSNMSNGNISISLNPAECSGKTLKITRQGDNPAWGGLTAKWISPILDVKAASQPVISVKKEVYLIENADGRQVASKVALKQGDKVRVTLTITTDRDMSYVSLADSRSACLAPDDQLSGYRCDSGLCVYREVHDEATIYSIPFLPKGVNTLTYDCHIDRAGEYSLGIATAESLMYPAIVAHSGGNKLEIKP